MTNGALICRDCHSEIDMSSVAGGSETNQESGLLCPNCGGESFGI